MNASRCLGPVRLGPTLTARRDAPVLLGLAPTGAVRHAWDLLVDTEPVEARAPTATARRVPLLAAWRAIASLAEDGQPLRHRPAAVPPDGPLLTAWLVPPEEAVGQHELWLGDHEVPHLRLALGGSFPCAARSPLVLATFAAWMAHDRLTRCASTWQQRC